MKGRRIRYSEAELAFVESHQAMARGALHAAFVTAFRRRGVTLNHIKGLCSRNGWTVRKRWSAADDALIRTLYPDTSTETLARRMGRTLASTYNRARTLGLWKSEAYLASPAACRLRRGDNVGAAHRFRKGQVPPNKGLRRPGWAPGRMQETQFKKGQVSKNWKPIGSTRLVDGYHYTKVSDVPHSPWTVNWKPTHILRWEAVHGPVPKGQCLKSLDGDRLNIDLSNWILVPRALLPRLSGKSGRDYDHAPSELQPTIMAIAKLEYAAAKRQRGAA